MKTIKFKLDQERADRITISLTDGLFEVNETTREITIHQFQRVIIIYVHRVNDYPPAWSVAKKDHVALLYQVSEETYSELLKELSINE